MLRAVPGRATRGNLGDVETNALGMKPVLALGTEHVMLAVILFLAGAEPPPPGVDTWASPSVEIEVVHHGAEPDGDVDGLVAKQEAPLQVGHTVDPLVE